MDKVITIETDTETEKVAKALAREAGLSLSGLVNACLQQAIISRQLSIYSPAPSSPKLDKILAEAEEELARGDVIGPFASYDEALAGLDKALEDQAD